MSNRHLEPVSTLVIDYGKNERWIGSWERFKWTNPNADIHNVETLHDYKKRMIPKNR